MSASRILSRLLQSRDELVIHTRGSSPWTGWQRDHLYAVSLLFALLIGYIVSNVIAGRKEAAVPVVAPRCPPQAKIGWKAETILSKPSIFGKDDLDASTRLIISYCPATGGVLDEIQADTEETINKKVQKALQVQRSSRWGHSSSWSRRRKLLRTIKKWMVQDMDTIARVACRDTGKTCVDAVLGEILTTLAKIDWLVSNGEKVLKPERRANNLLLAHKICTVYHEPFGVVTALVSWNYPCHNLLSPILAALVSGNAVVVKCSEMVVWSSEFYMKGLRACLAACNEPTDLVQLVCCFPSAAPALSAHPDIGHLTFIGSETVAHHVAKDAAKAMTPCCLELGGKDPMIILEDASLHFFSQTWLRAAFGSAGQNCIGAERFIVQSSILDKFIDIVEPLVKTLRQGSFLDDVSPAGGREGGIDVGAMISDNRFDTLEALIMDAEKQGARCLAGGRRFQHPIHKSGHYFSPTLLVNVTPEMKIAQEELFAPIFLVMAFDTLEQAVSIANGTRFALGASVFGGKRDTCRAIASQLSSGMVNINDFAVSYLNQGLPFGGNKASGNGQRFGGPEGLLSLTTTKAVTEDRFFSLIKTAIPGPVHYPHNDATKAYAFVASLATFFGADSWGASIIALLKLLRNSL